MSRLCSYMHLEKEAKETELLKLNTWEENGVPWGMSIRPLLSPNGA